MTARIALITGAAQGVGEAVARRLLRDGVDRLALVDRNRTKLEATASALRGLGAEVLPIAVDLSSAAICKATVAKAAAQLGGLGILANCAGNTERGGLLDTDEALFERIFAINLRAPFFLMQAAAKEMMKAKSGVIVSISSMLAYGGPPNLATYSASKAALVTLTKSAANTLKHHGIRVHAINLGWTVTPQEHAVQTSVHGLGENWAAEIGARQPFGRLLYPEDPAAVIAFLVSEEARMMTGNIIDLEQWVAGTMEGHPADRT